MRLNENWSTWHLCWAKTRLFRWRCVVALLVGRRTCDGRGFESCLCTIAQWSWASYLHLCASVTKHSLDYIFVTESKVIQMAVFTESKNLLHFLFWGTTFINYTPLEIERDETLTMASVSMRQCRPMLRHHHTFFAWRKAVSSRDFRSTIT